MVRPKAPAIVHVAIVVVLLLLGMFALTSRQPPPPTISEFAPQAVGQITDAPADQTSSAGVGAGLGAIGRSGALPTTGAGARPVQVARVRRCIGDPPRQIEDPQSPPCVPYFEGDNGGATWRGVTRDEIRVALNGGGDGGNGRFYRTWTKFFNKRFEFYGRTMRLVDTGYDGESWYDDPTQRAAAVRADEEIGAFASAALFEGFAYADELARRGIVSVSRGSDFSDEYMDAHHPYVWGYPMSGTQVLTNLGDWACRRLVGRPARFAGAGLAGKDRRFGILMEVNSSANSMNTQPLELALMGCGHPVAESVLYYSFNSSGDESRNAILRLRTSGVTTVFCLCLSSSFGANGATAESQGYQPEWIISSYGQLDASWYMKPYANTLQLQRTLGVTFIPRQVRPDLTPGRQAAAEADPATTSASGETSKGNIYLTAIVVYYRELLLLASGIQMAGPVLTPQAFARGLQRTRFPNPDTAIKSGAVGFQTTGEKAADHTMTDDGAEFWWSNNDRGPYEDDSPGTYCYVDGGARRRAGEWPAGDEAFFRAPCDSGT